MPEISFWCPIPISASGYKATPIAQFQFAYSPDKPLDRLTESERNAALVEIAEEIDAAFRKPSSCFAPRPHRPSARRGKPVTPVAPTGELAALHGVPGQRPNYLRRQEYLDALKQAVLGSTQQAVGITGATPQGGRIGLHGMGGIGKTVLAIDLVNDEEIRRAFPDGIYWLTLGQTIQPLQLQSELTAYIAGEAKAFATVNEARDQLRQLFEGKACLLVLDDLWHRAGRGAVRCARAALAPVGDHPRRRSAGCPRRSGIAARRVERRAALELLASWSGQARVPCLRRRRVAENCGYLPLALALAGARVQGGARWQEVLSALERGRLEFLDHQYGSVFRSLRLSTDAFLETERERYFEMAVFPEDADIPVEAICTLWRYTGAIEPAASRDLLLRLHRRALLTRSETAHTSRSTICSMIFYG